MQKRSENEGEIGTEESENENQRKGKGNERKLPNTDTDLNGTKRKLSTRDAVKNGKKMKVLCGNAEKERDESKVPTGDLEKNRNQGKIVPVKKKGRNWTKYPSIPAKQLKIIMDCLDGEHVFLLKRFKKSLPSLVAPSAISCIQHTNSLQTTYKFITMGSFIGLHLACWCKY